MVSLMQIFNFFEDQRTLIDRGEKAVKASDVQQFNYDPDKGEINAKVLASRKNNLYSVKIRLLEQIDSVECECPKGKDKCHHMAAVLIYMSKHVSCTNQPCICNSQKESKQRQNTEELFVEPKCLLKKKPTAADRDFFYQELKKNAPSSCLTWLMETEKNMTIPK